MPPPLRSAAAFGLSFRAATDQDLPFLAALYASTRAEEVAQAGWPEEVQSAFLKQQHEAQHAHYSNVYADAERLILLQNGEAIGRLYLAEWESEIRIVDISLVPASRGRGLGEALLRDVQEDAARRSKGVSIHVETFNPARRLYGRLGFAVIEDKGIYNLMMWRPDAAAAAQ
jgi:ribosomal protein S18 acetylase RimI-like enzyme